MIQSQQTSPTILELYTSQGCSSCPPAERWINAMTNHPGLWHELIPINFHVDYWDYLGWKDPFAMEQFSQRQRAYRRSGLTRNVATPGFVVNGEGWNGWFYGRSLSDASAKLKGKLSLIINAEQTSIRYESTTPAKALQVHLARLGFGIQTSVKRGENSGKHLQHDFVVTGHHALPLREENGSWQAQTTLPTSQAGRATREAIVVWVQDSSSPRPIQIAADWL